MEQAAGVTEAVAYVGKHIVPKEVLHISDIIDDWKESSTNTKVQTTNNKAEQEEISTKEVINPSVSLGEKLNESVLPNTLAEVIIRAAKMLQKKG
ncbi:MAG: hypothetical protein HC831_05905 [Chloroflexia bacterium]|nr:hypothetical protein [Chloroflexia bacterium]